MVKLILASSSPIRRMLLAQMGYKHDVIVAPDIDETEKKGELPRALAKRLCIEKAMKIAPSYPCDIVLAADTVACVGRRILPKAVTEEDAWYCINMISGRRHRIYTGVCVIMQNKVIQNTTMSVVRFKRLTNEEKTQFIQTKEWHNKAGGYTIRGFASVFIEWINGPESNILGLPTCTTYKMLSGVGLKPNNLVH